MNSLTLVIIYASITVAVTGHVFYFGVLSQPRVSVFSLSDYGMLALASLGIGAIWILFIPTLLVLGVLKVTHTLRSRSGAWTLPRAQQARAGS